MRNRYTAILLSIALAVAFVWGLFIEPSESQANPGTNWKGEYFANKDLAGSPALTVTDSQINFNWAAGAPQSGLPVDNFSVRWTASPAFATAGVYRFRTGADDGIRMYVDDVIIVNDFTGGPFRTQTADIQLTAGTHNLKVEYFEVVGNAGALVEWTFLGAVQPTVTPVIVPTTDPSAGGHVDFVSGEQARAHVATGVLNVRANPSVNAARLTQIYLYQSFPILGISADGQWYLIQLRDGRSGWVMERYIYRNETVGVPVVQSDTGTAATTPNIEVSGVATAELKIRVFPRTGEQIGIVPQDALLRVLARNSSGSWFYINWEGIEGWVYSPYIRLTNGRVMDLVIR